MTGPLCDHGRCAQILAAVAAREAGQADRLVEQLRVVFNGALDRLELTPEQRERVPAAVQHAVDELLAADRQRPAIEG